ncbi:antibiotic biosynthesis monooxygenase [Pseudomonas putida]|uniref:putative quinol monooxygenase n=1 Tax=Pseudomonas putida TaxID=303 RepID=UPI00117AF3B4|nr:antibiotic biosynthesis monooxygenase [Pseudomonas putida]TRO38258.1 antibiotic biosynthesis monooxygenase [Pseudomonas putida]
MRMPILLGTIAISCFWAGGAFCDESTERVVRIAQIVVEPKDLAAYQAAVKEEISDSVRLEPGVLAIYSVAEKDEPNKLFFFEIYANDAAYRSHISSPHFQKYAAITRSMIISKSLLETKPVQLSAKAQ